MRVAASIWQDGQLAKDRQVDAGAQGGFELGHGGDLLILKQALEPFDREADDIHNVILPPISPSV
jgi:hypothetical protein